MSEKIENIGKSDVIWSYAATFFMVGAGVILLPFILHKMPSETVGIWNIFQVITSLILMLDFGFRSTFARNISYIFSGVKQLQAEGVKHIQSDSSETDYNLLKGALIAMRRFYRYIALAAFVLLSTLGTAYFVFLLNKYDGDHQDAIIAWLLLITINCYNLYTFYYDALMIGKGYIKRTQQIMIIGQVIYLSVAITLIYLGLGLSAIVSAQLLSALVRRWLAYRVFFTPSLKASLAQAEPHDPRAIMKAIYPNAVKMGLTQVGAFAVNKSSILLGSAFLSLEQVAAYGITLQVMEVLRHTSKVPYQSFLPKLANMRASNDIIGLRKYYLLNVLSVLLVYVVGGLVWVLAGDWALRLIDSQTMFIPTAMLIVSIIIAYLEDNHSTAAGFIMADNKIPFFIPSLISGAATILLLWIFLGPLHWGLWGMVLASGIAQIAYQNWKWPSVVIRELWFSRT